MSDTNTPAAAGDQSDEPEQIATNDVPTGGAPDYASNALEGNEIE